MEPSLAEVLQVAYDADALLARTHETIARKSGSAPHPRAGALRARMARTLAVAEHYGIEVKK